MSQTDLAAEVGLTRQAISAFEQGSKNPEGATLMRISEVLRQPVAYFVAESQRPFGPLSARTYRAFGAATKRRNDQCDVLTEWLSTVATYIDGLINFPVPNIPSSPPPSDSRGYCDDEIEAAAERMRVEWGLGVGPIGNLAKLIESRGVFVGHLPVTTGRVNAFSYWCGDRPFIITGAEETTAVRRRFDLAHELGHLVLHQGIGEEELEDKNTLDQIESEANRFAGAFLLPRGSYPNEVFSTRLDAFVELKARWKVAVAAQIYRCSDLGIFSERQILNLRKQLSFKKWRTKEPLDDVLPVEQPQMIARAALMAVEAGATDPHTILNSLNLSPNLIEQITGLSLREALAKTDAKDPPISLK